MFQRFVEYVAHADTEELQFLSVEDMAICAAWYHSYANESARLTRCQGLLQTVERWVEEMEPPKLSTEGMRQQPLLRGFIDELQRGEIDRLERCEVDFLCIAFDLMQRTEQPALFERILVSLAPYMIPLDTRRRKLPLNPGLPALGRRLQVVTGDEIEHAPLREYETLGGIEMPGRGPVFTHRGNLKIVGYVPENCTVIVEDGACYVSGFVLGKLTASEYCEVRENISGTVVVTQGDVRVRNIINRAVVIAKLGQVRCRSAHSPSLVFGGKGIWIGELLNLGRFVSPRIEVLGDVEGGELVCSGEVSAKHFRPARSRPLSIVLRHEITCEDYGESIGPEGRRLVTHHGKLRQRLDNLERLIELADQESGQYASSALMYMCGGDKTEHLLNEIAVARRRLAFWDRLIRGIQALGETAETIVLVTQSSRLSPEELLRPAVNEPSSCMNEVAQELREIESEGGIDADLAEQRDEIAEWCHDLETGRHVAPAFLRRLRDKESVWQLERNKLRESIAAKEMQLGGVVGRMDILERANDDAARVHLLKQLIEAARIRPPEDVLAQRAKSVFVRLMLSNVSMRVERARSYRAAAESVRHELHAAEAQLANEYQIHMGKKETEHAPARARGRFDAEVALYAEHLPECEDGPIPPDLVVLEDVGKVERIFVLEDRRIVEATPPPAERAP